MNLNGSKEISLNTRLASIVIDHFLLALVCIMTVMPSMLSVEYLSPVLYDPYDYLALLGPTIYLCKDVVGGRSVGKYILKLQLLRERDGQVPSPFQCVSRNITCILWPVEVIVSMLNPARRIGDRLAGTRLGRVEEAHSGGITNFVPIIGIFIGTYIVVLSMVFLLSENQLRF